MKRLITTTALLAVLGLLFATLSGAAISVYKNNFSGKDAYKSVTKLGGNKGKCKRNWRKKSALGVSVKGKQDCSMQTPVEGDGKGPDHIVQVLAKVTQATDKKVRKSTYVGLIVRANRKESYELRVFPKIKRWQLLKSGEVLKQNRDKKRIKGFARKNKLELRAIGDTIVAKSNGKVLVELRDRNAEQVGGRKTGVSYGNRKSAKKAGGKAFFDKLKVQVPTP